MTGPDPTTPDLRAAHRARHLAAAPEALADLNEENDEDWPPRPPQPAGESQLAGEDWPAAGDPAGSWRLARGGEPDRVTTPPRAEPAAGAATDPAEADPADPAPAAASTSRAGRNLWAAVGVGLLLGGIVLASLLLWKPAFYGVILVAVWIATWEMVRAVGNGGLEPPLVPLLLGGTAMMGVAWYGGAEALPYGLLGTVIAVMVWRLADGPSGYQRDDVTALLIAAYVPFLGGFVVLLLAPDDGYLRVLAMLIGVVLSDTGGYAFGVFLGRHKLAPSVSPGKTWEGLAGSVVTAAVGGALIVVLMFDDDWWRGVVFGVAVAIASTLGDLAESLLKRDLKVKDMSNLLPGHGGLMDRLDSILLAAPVAYTVLTLLVPPG
jgi:phosphatidate cytidylyltransferase